MSCVGPIMLLVMLMIANKAIAGGLTFPRPQSVLGRISTAVMLAVTIGNLFGVALY
jgi:hypothetical protein